MTQPRVTLVFDRRKQVEKDGLGKLQIAVALTRQQRKYITICKCTPEEYPIIARKKSVADELERVQKVVDTLLELGEELTVENFNFHAGIPHEKRLSPEEKKEQERRGSFIAFMRDALAKEKICSSTRNRKERAINALEKFGHMKTFNDVTVPNIYKFEEDLQKPYKLKRGKNVQLITRDQTTIFNYHKVIHQYATRAWHFGIIDVDPYNLVKLDHGTYNERTPLTEEEVKRIIELTGMNYQMTMARDLFIFACYTGLAYIDTQTFVYEESVVEHNGMLFIDKHREKTNIRFYTPILQPALEVLERYNNKVPHLSNQKLNGYLKIIGEMAKIKKNVTFHVARHTFATIALAHDVPMENVSRMLGHTNTRTTAIYAKILDSTVQRHAEELDEELMEMPTSKISKKNQNIVDGIYYKDESTAKTATDKPVASAEPSEPTATHKKKKKTRRSKKHHKDNAQMQQSNNNPIETPRAEDAANIDYPGTSFGFNITGYYTMW